MRSQELGTAVVARMVPPNGCAGTFVETLGLANGRKLALVGLDTESLMNAPQEGCQPATREGVLGLVGSAVHAPDTDAIVFAHHPPASHGPHGGYAFMGRRDWTSWRNSLLGVVVGRPLSWIVHLVTGGRVPTLPLREDLSSGIYKRMARALEDAAAPAAGQSVIFAGGHDHSLQLLRRPSGALVAVSGSASNLTPICEGGRDLLLGLDKRGFMYADYFADGTVTLVALPLRMAADGAVLQVESPRPVTASGARRAGP
jgi:hypothetical protein